MVAQRLKCDARLEATSLTVRPRRPHGESASPCQSTDSTLLTIDKMSVSKKAECSLKCFPVRSRGRMYNFSQPWHEDYALVHRSSREVKTMTIKSIFNFKHHQTATPLAILAFGRPLVNLTLPNSANE
ncbi:hypothetical protein cyc_01347 [Cyclospora cayetanensis]|uniref:Uncharacterized protein n=1 Tax=Cyclospora cayetanensis TaxID=88456 RepID=A0A1D3D1E9_9EIME|nr:hypothetical protein cyc_01347 [Cyclospora cayetanensis]